MRKDRLSSKRYGSLLPSLHAREERERRYFKTLKGLLGIRRGFKKRLLVNIKKSKYPPTREEIIRRFLIPKLRKASLQWLPRREAIKRYKIGAWFCCAKCKRVVGKDSVHVDHVEAVAANGFIDWNDYINRMFCDHLGFQVLCVSCHQKKTATDGKLLMGSRSE